MNIEELKAFGLSKKGSEECFPFDEKTLVIKVMGKIFLIADIYSKPLEFNIKCCPEKAIELRETYPFVLPGYHMNKKHWNTVIYDNPVSKTLIKEWIDHSYSIVVEGLPKKQKQILENT